MYNGDICTTCKDKHVCPGCYLRPAKDGFHICRECRAFMHDYYKQVKTRIDHYGFSKVFREELDAMIGKEKQDEDA